MRLRLGQDFGPPGRCCKTTRQGRRCQEPLDGRGHHAQRCERGPACLRKHHGVQDCSAQLLNDAGLHATTEVYVPAWDRRRRDGTWQRARLDLRVEGGPDAAVCYADVVVAHHVSADASCISSSTGALLADGNAGPDARASPWYRCLSYFPRAFSKVSPVKIAVFVGLTSRARNGDWVDAVERLAYLKSQLLA